jgi:aminopeptidase N
MKSGNKVEILDKETEIDLERWSEVWVNQSGRPIISADLKLNQNGTISSLTISQKAEDGSEKVWPQIFDITLIYQETQKTFPISIFGERIEISEVIGLENPLTILYNSNGLGYGVFPMDMNFVNHIPQFENEVMRGQSYINLFENMLLGNINPSHVIEILRLGIRSEKNEIMSQLIGNQLSSVFWKFLTEEQRSAQQVIIEQELWQILQQDLPANLKKTIFTLYSGIAFNQCQHGRKRHGLVTVDPGISTTRPAEAHTQTALWP